MKKFYFAFIFLLSTFLIGQSSRTAVGTGIGIGSFNGDFPSQTTFNTKIYVETPSGISLFDKLNFSFTFGQKIEKFLPGNYKYDYYSYFTSFGVSGVFTQDIGGNLSIDEGIGLLYLNDRSFSDIDEWNIGMILNIAGGMQISKNVNVYLNIDYGLTFTNTNSSYIAFLVLCKYSF